jgi:hypothetical protein
MYPTNDAAKIGSAVCRRRRSAIEPINPPNTPMANTTLIHAGSERYSSAWALVMPAVAAARPPSSAAASA